MVSDYCGFFERMKNMSNIWKILKIEPTADARVIKRAYAALVRDCHQEDEPERWMELHEAYQKALEYAKQGRNKTAVLTEPSVLDSQKKDAFLKQKNSSTEAVEEKEEQQDNYTEVFDEIAVSERRKQQYLQVFPEIPERITYQEELDFMKFFFEAGVSTVFWKDLCFWQAFAEYMEQGEWTSWSYAYAYLVDKLNTFEKDESLMLSERVKIELRRQQYIYWQKCKEQLPLLPKHRPKHMLRTVIWTWRLVIFLVVSVLLIFSTIAGLIGRVLKYGSL